MREQAMIIVGDIVNTHGLRGEVKVLSDSDFKMERFVKGYAFYIVDQHRNIVDHVVLERYRQHKNFDLLTFVDKTSIQDVERYKGLSLAIDKEQARPLDEDEGYYHADIMASAIFDETEQFIGYVHQIVALPMYDLWYIKREDTHDLIVPFTDHFVKHIDIKARRIIIHVVEGMGS